MPATNTQFDDHTTGQAVVFAFPESVQDKVILITGANPGGIGLTTATSLAAGSPKVLVLAGRSLDKLAETVAQVKTVNSDVICRPVRLDLSSQQSCREAATQIINDPEIPRIDILINNAGIMNLPERQLSPEGIEMQFATNHIGHFLFTNMILDKIRASAKASKAGSTRIVNLSSRAVNYSAVRFSDYNFTLREKDMPEEEHMDQNTRKLWDQLEDKPYVPQAAYGQSKSANVLFSVELNKRLYQNTGILSIAVHPGMIKTKLSRSMDQEKLAEVMGSFKEKMPGLYMKNLEEGCATTLTAALDPQLSPNDIFLGDCQPAEAPAYCTDSTKAEKLWKLSEGLVHQEFTV